MDIIYLSTMEKDDFEPDDELYEDIYSDEYDTDEEAETEPEKKAEPPKRKALSESSKKNYASGLSSVKKSSIDIHKYNFDELNTFLETCSMSKADLCVSAILRELEPIENKTEECKLYLDKLHKYMKQSKKINQSDRQTKKASANQLKKFTTWKTITTIFKIFSDHVKTLDMTNLSELDKQIYWQYTIIAMYILIPPRRVRDYSTLLLNNEALINEAKVIDTNKLNDRKYLDEFEWPDKPSDKKIVSDKNYYREDGYLILSAFKTKSAFGTQYIKLPNELTQIINTYIRIFNIKQLDPLFIIKGKNYISTSCTLTQKLIRLFYNLTNQKIGASVLRHIYITYMRTLSDYGLFRHLVALTMGHSLQEQDEYDKIHNPDDIPYETLMDKFKEYTLNGKNAKIPSDKPKIVKPVEPIEQTELTEQTEPTEQTEQTEPIIEKPKRGRKVKHTTEESKKAAKQLARDKYNYKQNASEEELKEPIIIEPRKVNSKKGRPAKLTEAEKKERNALSKQRYKEKEKEKNGGKGPGRPKKNTNDTTSSEESPKLIPEKDLEEISARVEKAVELNKQKQKDLINESKHIEPEKKVAKKKTVTYKKKQS